jgi:N-acetylglucosamine-6-phosphate deacetylase
MPEKNTYTAKHIFTGEEWLQDYSIVVEGGMIKEIKPASSTAEETHHTIIPAFVDLQIYGAHGKLLSVFPEPATLTEIHKYSIHGGAYYFLPTVATNVWSIIFRCIDAIKAYWQSGGKGCLGLHVEGPWLNKEKRGAHVESLVHDPNIDEVKKLLEYGEGVIKMITLAPETCSDEIIQTILSYDVVISAGHSNMTYNESNEAFSKGITAVTHLYNAMSGIMHREVGLAGAAMLHDSVMTSIICDGYHVDYAAIKIAKCLMKERLYLITDAVTETRDGYYRHYRMGDKFVAGGILSGSALNMILAVKNVVHFADIETEESIRMATVYPAKAIKMEDKIGKIAKGLSAHFLITDEKLSFLEMIE